MDVDAGQLVYPSLKIARSKVDLDELAPVGGWPACRRDWRRLERFAEVRDDLPDRGFAGVSQQPPATGAA